MGKIPHNKFIERRKGESGASKIKCEKCGKIKRMLHMALFKGKILCSCCKPHIIN